MSCEIVIPSEGVEIEVLCLECKKNSSDPDVVIDLSTAISILVEIKGQKGNKKTVTNHSLSTDGTDGLLKFVTTTDQIDENGIWVCVVEATYSNAILPSLPVKFSAVYKEI